MQEAKALLGERRGLQMSLQAAQREAAALAGELAEARRALAATGLQGGQEGQRRVQGGQAWAATKEVRTVEVQQEMCAASFCLVPLCPLHNPAILLSSRLGIDAHA